VQVFDAVGTWDPTEVELANKLAGGSKICIGQTENVMADGRWQERRPTRELMGSGGHPAVLSV